MKEGVRNVARSIVGRPTFTFVRARAHSFPLSKRARLFPSAAYRRSAPPQLAAGKRTIVDVLKETAKLSECILTAKNEPIDYVPADISLATADMFLAQTMCREQILDKAISGDSISEDYDYLLIDCLPSLGILVMNALAAADEVIIPVQVQKFALNGIVQFEDIFNLIKEKINHDLKICGILETMTDNTQMAQAVDIALKERYGGLVYETTISKRIEAANSTAEQRSLISKKNSVIGGQYRKLVGEILEKEGV